MKQLELPFKPRDFRVGDYVVLNQESIMDYMDEGYDRHMLEQPYEVISVYKNIEGRVGVLTTNNPIEEIWFYDEVELYDGRL